MRTGEADASAVDWRGASRSFTPLPPISLATASRKRPSERERSQPKQCHCNSSLNEGCSFTIRSAAFIDGTGISKADLAALAPKLEAARAETLADLDLLTSKGNIPIEQRTARCGVHRPARAVVGRVQAGPAGRASWAESWRRRRGFARRSIAWSCWGSADRTWGRERLLEACCHPYHNELSRGERGGKPRMFFEGNNVDNDAAQGLLDVLGHGRAARDVAERWAIVVISKSGGTLETAAAFRIFLKALQQSLGNDRAAGRAACRAGDRPERAIV